MLRVKTGGGGTPYDGLYGGRLRPNAASGIQVYGRVGMSVVEVYKTEICTEICHLGP